MPPAKKPLQILVVDDEPNVGMIFHRILSQEGYEVISASNGEECLRSIRKQSPHLVFLDVRMPGIDGIETLRRIRETHPSLPVIVMTAYKTITSAIESMKLGAFDYLVKPLDTDKIKAFVKQALDIQTMFEKTQAAERKPEAPSETSQNMVATGEEMRQILSHVTKVAPTNLTVLILGESGTGKELVARAIHMKSARSKGPFVVVDCAALPESLIESELFGYEKGAFTGADVSKPGKFESANGGTLFLDEIGNLPLNIQAKLLRFLQEPTVERLGARKGPIRIDVRVVAATNSNLEKGILQGTFREDLYHRLKVFLLQLPPLRQRGEAELQSLTEYFLKGLMEQFNKTDLRIAPETFHILKSYRWPGNIRELQNALRSAALLSDGVVLPEHLPMSIQTAMGTASVTPEKSAEALSDVIKRVEREHISQALQRFQGDKEKTAAALGIDPQTLLKKISELGI